MAVHAVPAITLTDPQNRDSAPSPAQSPIKAGEPYVTGRPVTPSRSSASEGESVANGRPDTNDGHNNGRMSETSSNGAERREPNGGAQAQPAMDPLSQHILKRTNTPNTVPTIRRPVTPDGSSDATRHESTSAPAVQSPPTRQEGSDSAAQRDLKKGVKAVSFLSRLIGNKKKDAGESVIDDTSSISDQRPEGHHAEPFAQPVDSMGYNPQHAAPPEYIKVRSKHKQKRDFDRLFLAQQMYCKKQNGVKRIQTNKLRRKSSVSAQTDSTVWAMEFSRDGRYLAAAGADMIVRVWAVLSSSDERQQHESQESQDAGGSHAHLSAPVFQSKPTHELEGHTSTILDLSWSKNNFLLSSSMDKTVRLWHVSRSECLCTFKHNDFVPSIAFHPKDDRFFLAGSLDSKLRLWSIPDKSVAYIAQLPDLITAVAFSPDGRHAMAGCLNGLCMFFETEGLKYSTQIHVRSSRGQNAKGSKITGIQSHHSPTGDVKLLITSNDSRVRLYNFRDKSLEVKFKGNENNCSQIRATLSDDGQYVVSGSEDCKAYIWSMGPADGERREKRPVEMFDAHDTITTAVCFAPTNTRHLLSKSEDPIYDLCNPPPVMLMSRAERAQSHSSSKPPTENGSIQQTPADAEGTFKKPGHSPAYVTRSGHKEGHIIVTADYTGMIKVFRQDCAWAKRRSDDFDKGSLFSKRGNRTSIRQGSVTHKTSQPSLREARTSTSTEAPSARILSWRQGISSTSNVPEGGLKRNDSSRSISPKPLGQRRESQLRSATTASDGSAPSTNPTTQETKSPIPPTEKPRESSESAPGAAGLSHELSPEERRKREENPLCIQDGRSYMFWDTENWKAKAKALKSNHREPSPPRDVESSGVSNAGGMDYGAHLDVRPSLNNGDSFVSKLSDEVSRVSDEQDSADEFDDAREGQDYDMTCKYCGGTAFSARRGQNGETTLACGTCGKQAR